MNDFFLHADNWKRIVHLLVRLGAEHARLEQVALEYRDFCSAARMYIPELSRGSIRSETRKLLDEMLYEIKSDPTACHFLTPDDFEEVPIKKDIPQ